MSADEIVAILVLGQFVLIGGWFAFLHWLDAQKKRRAAQRRGP